MERVKAIFELEMDDEYYQHILDRIEKNGEYTFPMLHTDVVVRKTEAIR